MKKSKAAFAAAALLFAAAALFFAGSHLFIGWRGWTGGTAPGAADSRELDRRWQELAGATRDWQGIEAEYADFRRSAMMRATEFAAFRGDLEALIARNGLERRALSYTLNESAAMQVKFYRVTLSLAGSYPSLKKFVHDIEGQERLTFLSKLTLIQEKDIVAATIELEAYFAE